MVPSNHHSLRQQLLETSFGLLASQLMGLTHSLSSPPSVLNIMTSNTTRGKFRRRKLPYIISILAITRLSCKIPFSAVFSFKEQRSQVCPDIHHCGTGNVSIWWFLNALDIMNWQIFFCNERWVLHSTSTAPAADPYMDEAELVYLDLSGISIRTPKVDWFMHHFRSSPATGSLCASLLSGTASSGSQWWLLLSVWTSWCLHLDYLYPGWWRIGWMRWTPPRLSSVPECILKWTGQSGGHHIILRCANPTWYPSWGRIFPISFVLVTGSLPYGPPFLPIGINVPLNILTHQPFGNLFLFA